MQLSKGAQEALLAQLEDKVQQKQKQKKKQQQEDDSSEDDESDLDADLTSSNPGNIRSRLEEAVDKKADKLPHSDVLIFLQFPLSLRGKLRHRIQGLTDKQAAKLLGCLLRELPWRDRRLASLLEEYEGSGVHLLGSAIPQAHCTQFLAFMHAWTAAIQHSNMLAMHHDRS